MSQQTPLASTASAIGPCPTIIQIVGHMHTCKWDVWMDGWGMCLCFAKWVS